MGISGKYITNIYDITLPKRNTKIKTRSKKSLHELSINCEYREQKTMLNYTMGM